MLAIIVIVINRALVNFLHACLISTHCPDGTPDLWLTWHCLCHHLRSLWRWCIPPPFPDFSLFPASWTLSCCHSTLKSSSLSISGCHQYTSLDFQFIVLCYWFQLVWSSGTPADHLHANGTQHCVFYIYHQEVRYREWKGLVPGLMHVEHCMRVWLDPILHGPGLHQSPLFETCLLGNCVVSSTQSHQSQICIPACLIAGNG